MKGLVERVLVVVWPSRLCFNCGGDCVWEESELPQALSSEAPGQFSDMGLRGWAPCLDVVKVCKQPTDGFLWNPSGSSP